MRKIELLLILLFVATSTFAKKKQISAVRVSDSPKIDGVLDEPMWKNAKTASNFIQIEPYNGKKPSEMSEVKVLYDDVAVYIGAKLHDSAPDSIITILSTRDNRGRADYFGVYIDPYNYGLTGFGFWVNTAGVQTDAKIDEDGHSDESWDAVWYSAVSVDNDGWYVELKIPYSALRFSKKEVQTWGINFKRHIERHREQSMWNFVDKNIDGFLNQSGEVTDLKNIEPPVRLSFTPYFSIYMENNPDNQGWSTSVKGGMDLKYGISESFTLDMILIPDFGQVESDDKRLNLSPYEQYYSEKRPFFTEGVEMFERADIFYSRRIGTTPVRHDEVYDNLKEDERVTKNIAETTLINATKISGKTKSGLGIGFLNAMTAAAYAEITNIETNERHNYQTQPFTNYNVLVLDQSLKNNSYISLINTNLSRFNDGFSANVTGGEIRIANKKKTYAIEGQGALSQQYDENAPNQFGYYYSIEAGKVSGKLNYSYEYQIENDTYDPNDMGYMRQNNEIQHSVDLSYNQFDPFWIFLDWYNSIGANYEQLYNPRLFSKMEFDFRTHATTKKHLFLMLDVEVSPLESFDYYEPRYDGRKFKVAPYLYGMAMISTDYRKKFAVDFRYNGFRMFNNSQSGNSYMLRPRFRVNDKLLIVHSFYYEKNDELGYVSSEDENEIYFGRRDFTTISNTLNADYIFTNKASLSVRVRHNWSRADYNNFYLLNTNGSLSNFNDYTENVDINYNAFTIDMAYKWNFAPGSELSIVWKNDINTYNEYIISSFAKNFDHTLSAPQTNSFSIRLLYYLDYLYLKELWH